jgi:hypothetical protein
MIGVTGTNAVLDHTFRPANSDHIRTRTRIRAGSAETRRRRDRPRPDQDRSRPDQDRPRPDRDQPDRDWPRPHQGLPGPDRDRSVEVGLPIGGDAAVGAGYALVGRVVLGRGEVRTVRGLLIAVVPEPGLTRLEGPDHRMAGRLPVRRRMLSRGCVAAPDMATAGTSAQVEPPAAHRVTLRAAGAARRHGNIDITGLVHRYPSAGRNPYPIMLPLPAGHRAESSTRVVRLSSTRAPPTSGRITTRCAAGRAGPGSGRCRSPARLPGPVPRPPPPPPAPSRRR